MISVLSKSLRTGLLASAAPKNPLLSRSFAAARAPGVLQQRMAELVPTMRKEFADLKKQYSDKSLGTTTVGQALGGMRGIHGLICETSLLDENEGIRFRNYTIPECQKLLPKAPGGAEPLPEGLLWLLLTGEVPNQKQVDALTQELHARSTVPEHVKKMLHTLPSSMHPMSQLTAAVCALQTESSFARRYQEGTINKNNYWEAALDDSLDLIARLPEVAAIIYNNVFKSRTQVTNHRGGDWGSNFASMLGFSDPKFHELMRLYLTVHADHEGGNVSAHATHLVGSALSDPYLSYAAGMAGLAGPLHGLANQEVLRWIVNFSKQFKGQHPSKEQLRQACWDTLNSGHVIPGYGHAVLRKTDPRYLVQREFALKHLPNDPMFRLVSDLFEVVPEVLTKHGKTKNPWPNVDAHSGVLLQYYGLKEQDFYTVLFGVSRALGVLSSLTVDRVLGLPIERPKSITSQWIKQHYSNPNAAPPQAE